MVQATSARQVIISFAWHHQATDIALCIDYPRIVDVDALAKTLYCLASDHALRYAWSLRKMISERLRECLNLPGQPSQRSP
jgi:hypothetical protein